MLQKPPAKAPSGSWSQAPAPRMQQQPVARAPRGSCSQATAQNAATACGKGAARHLEAGKCLTLPSEATRKALGKRSECCKSLRRRRRGHLKPGYCPQNAATARGKGAARDLEAGKCLTLLSEATRKALGKRPECCKSLRRRRREAVEARLLPPECSNSLWQGRREAFGGKQVANVAFWSH